MHDNVLLTKDLLCSKRLWHFTFTQTIGYFSIFLNVVFDPPTLPFSLCVSFCLGKLIRLSSLSMHGAK